MIIYALVVALLGENVFELPQRDGASGNLASVRHRLFAESERHHRALGSTHRRSTGSNIA